jgi:hypothetical protein
MPYPVKVTFHITSKKKSKVKEPHNRPSVVQRDPGGLGSQIS